jgi:hypothetical protein
MAPFPGSKGNAFELSSVSRAVGDTLLTTHPKGQAALRSLMTLTDMKVGNFVAFVSATHNMDEKEIIGTPREQLEVMINCFMIMVKTGLSTGSPVARQVWDTAVQLESDLNRVLEVVQRTFKQYRAVMTSDNMIYALSAAINTDTEHFLRQAATAATATLSYMPSTMDIPAHHNTARWIFPRPSFTKTLAVCDNAELWQFNLTTMIQIADTSSRKHDSSSSAPSGGKRARTDDTINPRICYKWRADGKCDTVDCQYAHSATPTTGAAAAANADT